MSSAGNLRYIPSSYTYSVCRPAFFLHAADPCMCTWEGITPEQRPRAEQGQMCTQRHYGTMASASSTVLSRMCGEKELLSLGRGWEHSAAGSRAVPCPYVAALHSLPFLPLLTSCAVCPSTPPTLANMGSKEDYQELVGLAGGCVAFFVQIEGLAMPRRVLV